MKKYCNSRKEDKRIPGDASGASGECTCSGTTSKSLGEHQNRRVKARAAHGMRTRRDEQRLGDGDCKKAWKEMSVTMISFLQHLADSQMQQSQTPAFCISFFAEAVTGDVEVAGPAAAATAPDELPPAMEAVGESGAPPNARNCFMASLLANGRGLVRCHRRTDSAREPPTCSYSAPYASHVQSPPSS